MALFYQRGSGTTINIDSPVQKPSLTNGSAARKFVAPDDADPQDDRDVIVKTNDELLIEQAASLKGVSLLADSMAARARASLAAARTAVSSTPGEPRPVTRPPPAPTTPEDVINARSQAADDLAANAPSAPVPFGDVSHDLHNTADNSFLSRADGDGVTILNGVVPDISVTIEIDHRRAAVDCFCARVSMSIPRDLVDGNLKLLRVFRSTVFEPSYDRGVATLSAQGVSRVTSQRIRTRTKNPDLASQTDIRLQENLVPNAVGLLNPIDPNTNARIAASSDIPNQVVTNPVPRATVMQSPASVAARSFVNAPRTDNLDPSVASDLNVLRNIQLQDPAVAAVSVSPAVVINLSNAKKEGLLNVTQGLPGDNDDVQPGITRNDNNSLGFDEIATLSFDRLKARKVGDQLVYELNDDQVSFGAGYRYFCMTVDADMIDSSRSQIVEVVVEAIRVPESPKIVTAHTVGGKVALSIFVEDRLVEKFEVFRKEANPALLSRAVAPAKTLATPRGFNIDVLPSQRLPNGFVKIGECINGTSTAGATYQDISTVPGQKYFYRVYSVDIFGNKSERPFEIGVYVPDPSSRPNELVKPHLAAQVDSKTNLVLLTFSCTDSRVRGLFLARRDLTIGQSAFTTPAAVNHLRFGRPKGAEGGISFEGELLRGEGPDLAWTGFFENSAGDITFVDKTVAIDHVYQYKIYGVDIYGNRTSDDITPPLMVVRRPMVDAPVNVVAEVIQGPDLSVGGIRISWQEANVTIAPEDHLGSQSALRDTKVRTLYQLERRKIGEERWVQFPLVPDLSFFDPTQKILGNVTPGFRPQTVEENQTYAYRVQAVQTGSFVSNYSQPVQVFASLPILAPANFRLRTSAPGVDPIYVALNWDTPAGSGVVDRWEIERSVVNNVAAAKLNPRSSADFQKLKFSRFRTVHLESSRFRAQVVDDIRGSLIASATPPQIFTGEHHFQDAAVSRGNTYFYRIRAISLDDTPSAWVYRGMKLTDQKFEKAVGAIIGADLKNTLANNMVPLIVNGVNPPTVESSFSLQSSFAQPDTAAGVSVGAESVTYNPGGGTVPQSKSNIASSTKGLTGF